MWRPLEVFLYDWWPIRAEAHLFDRLSTMPVRIEYKETAFTDAWRADWPAVSASEPRPSQARGDHQAEFRRRAMSPTTRNISTPPTKNEGFGKRPSIRRLRDRSPRVIRRLRIRIQTTTRRSNVSMPKRSRRTREPGSQRRHAGNAVSPSLARSVSCLPSATTRSWRPRYRTSSPEQSIRRYQRRAGETARRPPAPAGLLTRRPPPTAIGS